MDSFVLLAYASLAALKLLAGLNLSLDSEDHSVGTTEKSDL